MAGKPQKTDRELRQEVSNRSILRVQIISERLRDELNLLPAFKANKVKKVLFAARDEKSSFTQRNSTDSKAKREWYKPPDPNAKQPDDLNARRWYDFRLCDTLSFDNEGIRSWLRGHYHEFEPLFRAARHEDRTTQADFQTFQKAVEAGVKHKAQEGWDKAQEQFLIALAVIPYRGVLLTLFENRLGWFASDTSRERACYCFSGTLKGMKFRPYEKFQSACDFSDPAEEQDKFWLHPDLSDYGGSEKEPLWRLFRFILPFTRGEELLPNLSVGDFPYPPEPGFEEEANREQTASQAPPAASPKEMHGFTVPACDYDEQTGQWRGGMGGWIVVVTEKAPDNTAPDGDTSWEVFTRILLRRYLHDVREAHMLDLLEEYAALSDPPDPDGYFKDHIHHLIGWRWDDNDPGTTHIIPFDAPTPDFPLHIKPLWDTYWPDPTNLFFVSTRRLLKTFLEDLRLVHSQRQAGLLASKHDYSKDLNSNDIRMDRYERHVKQEREKLQLLIEKTWALETTDADDAAKSTVVEGLKEVHREYGVPMLDLMALTRYQMMRQKAKDAGSLYEEPQFCVERLIDGTKNDVVRVVNLLVWMRSPEWIDPARAPQENGRDFAAWGRIFAYETVSSNHLSGIAEHLFHDLGFQLEEVDHYFPRPLLRCLLAQHDGEREAAPTEPFLWPQHEGNPARPHLIGFFPLFVEAMRAAYLHAYAATLDSTLALGRKQDVPRRDVGVLHPFQQFITLRPSWRLERDGRVRDYRLKISFFGPASLAAPSAATLPLGDWHRESSCFQKLVSQWKSSVTTGVTLGQQPSAFSITIASH